VTTTHRNIPIGLSLFIIIPPVYSGQGPVGLYGYEAIT